MKSNSQNQVLELTEPAIKITPYKIVLSSGIDTANFLPPVRRQNAQSRIIRATQIANGSMRVGDGALFAEDGQPIDETLYMLRKYNLAAPDTKRALPSIADDRVIVIGFNAGWRNFYHSTIQGFFSMWLCKNHFKIKGAIYLFPGNAPWQLQFLDLLGIKGNERLLVHKNDQIKIDKAVICSTAYENYVYRPSPLLRQYSDDLIKNARLRSRRKAGKYYISRRDSTKRQMKNELDFEIALQKKGYQIVQLSQTKVAEQIAVFRSAKKVVAPHGAGLSNIIFCEEGCDIFELTPQSYVNPCFASVSEVIGLNHSVLVSSAKKGEPGTQPDGWSCDTAFLDLI